MLNECFKEIVKETYYNVCEEGSHKYKKLNEKDFDDIVARLIDSDDLWNLIDGIILENLEKYECK